MIIDVTLLGWENVFVAHHLARTTLVEQESTTRQAQDSLFLCATALAEL